MFSLPRQYRIHILFILFAVIVGVWYLVFSREHGNELVVSFLDVGQGDAIFIESPEGNQMMIDGGPDATVLRELGSIMPLYDRSIDMLLVSNPDKDHMAGFIDVVESFSVDMVVEPGTRSDTAVYKEFVRVVEEKDVQRVIARKGMSFRLGERTVFDVLFPDRDVSGLDTNTGSIIGVLRHGTACIVFPGDAPEAVEEYVVEKSASLIDCDVLKVGHHGSKTSTGDKFLNAVSPSLAIISAGKSNRYGHPHAEVVDRLGASVAGIFVTAKNGRITLFSDGETFYTK